MSVLDKVVVVIPSLSPDNRLVKYIDELTHINGEGFKKIIIVNDGSSDSFNEIFERIEKEYSQIIILKHVVNQGKGRALKTAFNYYLNNLVEGNSFQGIVTADSDGQHTPEDTYLVSKALLDNPHSLVLGTRNFDEENVPFKSRYGNKITTLIFKLLFGKKIYDTQTGLRGIPNEQIKDYLSIEGERFEYEINMLIKATSIYDIYEQIIKTVYENNNESTHFNPVVDSFKIYRIMLRQFLSFSFSGIASFLLDSIAFAVLINMFNSFFSNYSLVILWAALTARVVSSLFNYYLNKNFVFKKGSKKSIFKYYFLCIAQISISAFFTILLEKILGIEVLLIKICVDVVLFYFSFKIQSKYIFK